MGEPCSGAVIGERPPVATCADESNAAISGADFNSCTYTLGINARRTTDESSLAIAPCAGMMPEPNCGIVHTPLGALAPLELSDELMRHVARGPVGGLGELFK